MPNYKEIGVAFLNQFIQEFQLLQNTGKCFNQCQEFAVHSQEQTSDIPRNALMVELSWLVIPQQETS